MHTFSDGTDALNLRTTLARELATQGAISAGAGASGAAFQAEWNWIWGMTIKILDASTELSFVGGTVSVSGDGGACKLYYLNDARTYRQGLIPQLIDFARTTVLRQFVVICPRSFTGPVTLTANGFVNADTMGAVSLAPVTIALVPDTVVSLDWGN